MTRQEKTEAVRAALVGAAARLFAERGFDRTSLDLVAEEAGLTKGAVYSNFKNKEDLFFAACGSVATSGSSSALDSRGPLTSRLARWARSIAQTSSAPGADLRSALDAEALQLALRSERTRAWVAAQSVVARDRLAALIAQTDDAAIGSSASSSEELATLLLSLLRGLVLQRTMAPETVPDRYFVDAVRFLIAGTSAINLGVTNWG